MFNYKNIQVEDDVERLLIIRKRLNMKQYEFARAIGISKEHLGRIESYKEKMSMNVKKRVVQFVESKIDQ